MQIDIDGDTVDRIVVKSLQDDLRILRGICAQYTKSDLDKNDCYDLSYSMSMIEAIEKVLDYYLPWKSVINE